MDFAKFICSSNLAPLIFFILFLDKDDYSKVRSTLVDIVNSEMCGKRFIILHF